MPVMQVGGRYFDRPENWKQGMGQRLLSAQQGAGMLAGQALQKSTAEAKAANLARYEEGKTGYQNRYNDALNQLEGMGAQESADIRQDWRGRETAQTQDLVSRGLTGSSVLPTMKYGIQQGMSNDLGRLNERLRQQRLSYQTGLEKDRLDFIERREDEYPDLGSYNALMAQAGQAADYGQTAYNPQLTKPPREQGLSRGQIARREGDLGGMRIHGDWSTPEGGYQRAGGFADAPGVSPYGGENMVSGISYGSGARGPRPSNYQTPDQRTAAAKRGAAKKKKEEEAHKVKMQEDLVARYLRKNPNDLGLSQEQLRERAGVTGY